MESFCPLNSVQHFHFRKSCVSFAIKIHVGQCHLNDLWEVVPLFVAELSSWATKSWFLTSLVTFSWQCNLFLLLSFWTEELLLIVSYPNLTKQTFVTNYTFTLLCVFIIKNLANISCVVQNHIRVRCIQRAAASWTASSCFFSLFSADSLFWQPQLASWTTRRPDENTQEEKSLGSFSKTCKIANK